MNLRANIEARKRNYLPSLFLSIKIGLKFLKLFSKVRPTMWNTQVRMNRTNKKIAQGILRITTTKLNLQRVFRKVESIKYDSSKSICSNIWSGYRRNSKCTSPLGSRASPGHPCIDLFLNKTFTIVSLDMKRLIRWINHFTETWYPCELFVNEKERPYPC